MTHEVVWSRIATAGAQPMAWFGAARNRTNAHRNEKHKKSPGNPGFCAK
jgi:hypothetical protein